MSLTTAQATKNAKSALSRRPLPQPEKLPRVPCLAARGFAHRRRVVRVGDFREEATCRHCGDVQQIDHSGADLTLWNSDGDSTLADQVYGWPTWR